jgi:hypothetical protein
MEIPAPRQSGKYFADGAGCPDKISFLTDL